MIKWAISLLTIFIFIFINALSDFELSEYGQQRIISFKHNKNFLVGTLIIPTSNTNNIFIVIVHGDGPQDRWSDGGYIPLVKYLVSQGFSVFSWDKPGVGKSTGNWLAQTMSERAEEAVLAVKKIREQSELSKSKGGYIGFSQAGWVVPKAIKIAEVDFAVLIGAAINWKSQGLYYMEKRLNKEGFSASYIQQTKMYEDKIFDNEFTEKKVILPCIKECTRSDFERRNSLSDATSDISDIHIPILILMGKDDRNVNPDETGFVWNNTLPFNTMRCIRKIPRATHGLLRSEWFDYQISSQWPLWKNWLFIILGKYSYSPNALNTISSFIINQKCI